MTTLKRPEKPAGGLSLKTDITPEDLFRAIGRLRKEARDEIDRLIRFLDDTDNHMEREPDDEADGSDVEPSLGSFDGMINQDKSWRQTNDSDCDAVGYLDREQDDADSEDADPAEESDTGIGDLDGLMEQHPVFYGAEYCPSS